MKFKTRERRYFLLIVSFRGRWKRYGEVRWVRTTKRRILRTSQWFLHRWLLGKAKIIEATAARVAEIGVVKFVFESFWKFKFWYSRK